MPEIQKDINAIRNFFFKLNLRTEGISYFIIVTFAIFYVFTNLNLRLAAFNEMKSSIKDIGSVIEDVFEFTRDLTALNERIQKKIDGLGESSKEIRNSTNEQKITNEELTRAVDSINVISQKTAENADLLQRAAVRLGESAVSMKTSVSRFKF